MLIQVNAKRIIPKGRILRIIDEVKQTDESSMASPRPIKSCSKRKTSSPSKKHIRHRERVQMQMQKGNQSSDNSEEED